jgi:hypothetical protein
MSRYWLFSGDVGMDYTHLKTKLRAVGLLPYPDGDLVKNGQLLYSHEKCDIKQVDFLHVELLAIEDITNNIDPNTYRIHTRVHNILDMETVDLLRRKDQLHASLAGTEFIAKTVRMDEFEYTGGVWILRPSSMFAASGNDIMIVSNSEEFNSARDFYTNRAQAHQRFHKLNAKYYVVIVSQYITQPMLFRELKFHLRLYMFTTPASRPKISRKHGKIITAAEPYKQADWSNKRIHDTHLKSTSGDFFFPRDFPAQEMLPGINEQLDALENTLALLCNKQAPYKEQTELGYHIFGLDIMVRDTGKIVLIEINERPGITCAGPCTEFQTQHCEWVWNNIADMFTVQ